MSRDDSYLLDMLVAARKARAFVAGLVWEDFATNEIAQHAVMRMIQIVGEAANRTSDATRASYPQIPWREIIGMRHRLVHDYFGTNLARVWTTVQDDLPALIAALEAIVPPDERDDQ